MTREKRKRRDSDTSSKLLSGVQSAVPAVRQKIRTSSSVHSCELNTATAAGTEDTWSEGAAGSPSDGNLSREVNNGVKEELREGNTLEDDVRTTVLRTLAKRKEGSSM